MKPDTRILLSLMVLMFQILLHLTGSSLGAALTTDTNGSDFKTFDIPDLTRRHTILNLEQVTRTFRLTSSVNTLTGDLFTSAEVDYTAKGLMQHSSRYGCFN